MYKSNAVSKPEASSTVATLSYGVKVGEKLKFTKIASLEKGQGKAQYKAELANGVNVPSGARIFIFPEEGHSVTKGSGRDIAANLTVGHPEGDKTKYTKVTGLFHANGKAQYNVTIKEGLSIEAGTLFVFPADAK